MRPKALALVIAAILLICLLVIQFAFNVFLFQRIANLENSSLKTLISEAIANVNKDAAVEPQTGKVYLYEPKLVLPAYPEILAKGIEYTYTPATTEGTEEELQLTSKSAMTYGTTTLNRYASEERLFEAVPIAQACTRQIIITFKPAEEAPFDGYKKVGTRQLADGRTLQIFVTDQCPAEAEVLVNYVQQIQSY